MKKRIIVSFLFFFYFSYSYTTEELISLAERNNPELIKIQKELRVLKKKVEVAKKLFNPSISVSLSGDRLFKEPLRAGKIYIKQYVPYPKKFDIQKSIEKKKYMSEYYLLVAKKENIFSQIYETAYSIWLIQQNISVYRRSLEELKIFKFEHTEDKIRKKQMQRDILVEIYQLETQKDIYLARLEKLINTDINTVNISLKDVPQIKLTSLEERLKESPFYKSVEFDIEKAREVYKLSKLVYYPDFSISARIDTGGSLMNALSLGVNVKIPVWRTLKQEQDVLTKRLGIIAQKEKLRFILNDLLYKTKKSLLNISLAKKLIPILKTSIKDLYTEYKIRKEKKENTVILFTPFIQWIKKQLDLNRYIYISNSEYIKVKAILGEL